MEKPGQFRAEINTLMEGIAQESAPLLVALLENRLKGFRV
jgi:hypothetical protein